MSARQLLVGAILFAACAGRSAGDIKNWQTNQTIPGTVGITPGPYSDFESWNTASHNLQYAQLSGINLHDAYFAYTWLDNAHFIGTTLRNTYFVSTSIAGADFTAAAIDGDVSQVYRGATFGGETFNGFTPQQLYSTASYQAHNLQGVTLADNHLEGWNFAAQDLRSASFHYATVTGTDFTDADVRSADFSDAQNFTPAQLYSTASYKSGDLGAIPGYTGISLSYLNVAGWNFTGKNLRDAQFASADLTGASFAGANLTSAYFGSASLTSTDFTNSTVNHATLTSGDFSSAQLYSTASYKAGDLSGIKLGTALSGWNFTNQNLTGAVIVNANLFNAKFTGANLSNAQMFSNMLTGADFTNAILTNLNFSNQSNVSGTITATQLYSTASYKNGDLSGINFYRTNLGGFNFTGKNLTNVSFESCTLSGAALTNATVKGVNFRSTTSLGFTQAQLASTASYKSHDLPGVNFSFDDLSGWNLSSQNLAGATFTGATLTNTNLADADLRGTTGFAAGSGTITKNAILANGSVHGLSLAAAETLVVRDHPTAVLVDTSASFNPSATLRLLIADTNWTSAISFNAALTPALGGTLDLEFADGVNPSSLLGDSFTLFHWNAPLAGGNDFDSITTAAGVTWDTSALYTSGVVRLAAVPEPGTTAALVTTTGAALAPLVRRSARRRLRL
jgi:uncharacterized protein YjbI with pentapeptide repeats